MSDEERYTERDLILAKREGYVRRAGVVSVHGIASAIARADAERVYPLPKVTRPRVVADPLSLLVEWRVLDGRMQAQNTGYASEMWRDVADGRGLEITPERVRVWADLFANPTETVDKGTP